MIVSKFLVVRSKPHTYVYLCIIVRDVSEIKNTLGFPDYQKRVMCGTVCCYRCPVLAIYALSLRTRRRLAAIISNEVYNNFFEPCAF